MADHPQWRGQRDTRARVFRTLVALSLLLHLPLTPLGALVGLLSLLGPPPPDAPDLGEIQGIPVTLLSPDELAALGLESPPPPAPEPSAPPPQEAPLPDEDDLEGLFDEPEAPKPEPEAPKPEQKPSPIEPADAGAGESPQETPEKTPAPEPPAEAADGGAGPAPQTPAPRGPPSDPGALVGSVASVTDPNANVKLLLYNDRIAQHPAGPRIGSLLRRVPQWRSFFGPAGLDPVKDIRRVYIAGPQFRESADVVAVLEYGVSEPQMRAAIDAIVQREPRGEWLSTKPPAARARADRAERTFVLARPGIIAMVPPRLTQDTIAKASSLRFPAAGGDAAVVAFVNTPWRVLIGFDSPVSIPKSISSLMIQVVPEPGGAVSVRFRAVDASEQEAKDHASVLERGINLLTQREMGALGSLLFGSQKLQLLEPVSLKAEGKTIVGSARATPRQLDRMLNFLESWLDAIENRGRIEQRKRAAEPRREAAGQRSRPVERTGSGQRVPAPPAPEGPPTVVPEGAPAPVPAEPER